MWLFQYPNILFCIQNKSVLWLPSAERLTLTPDLQASRGGVLDLQAQLQDLQAQLEAQQEGQRAQAQQQEEEKEQQLARLREDAVSQSQLLDSCQSRVRTARRAARGVGTALGDSRRCRQRDLHAAPD